MTRNVLLSSLILAIVGAGAYSALKSVGATAQDKTAVNVNNNVIINIASREAGLTPEKIEGIIKAAVNDKKANAKDAVEFIRPAKRDANAIISIDSKEALSIPRETINLAPSSLDFEQETEEQPYYDVDLQIRATNRDSTNSGWAGIVPLLMSKRVKLELSDGIKPDSVAGKFEVRADIVVHSRRSGDKNKMQPYKIILQRLIKE